MVKKKKKTTTTMMMMMIILPFRFMMMMIVLCVYCAGSWLVQEASEPDSALCDKFSNLNAQHKTGDASVMWLRLLCEEEEKE